MSYQVLARKWRPRDFESLVGQEHVVKALTHALDQQRLHHAYLFTGTRGVGKTTLARILAKALNCETGVTSRPCGKCSACTEIDSGRFVDLLEVDAATNTKVDEMRALLENAVYSPSRGRFKIYVIDEVHMLSTSAFNAMLKTLEEPPEHMKFILATTDPQKIPVTVLSRCLQFNLKQMPAAAITAHLAKVLGLEQLAAEEGALKLIAASARGSMRDALSLLDQAIAYCAGQLTETAVREMLGAVDQGFLFDIAEALARGDARAALAVADHMESLNISFDGALQELASLYHRVALTQSWPETIGEDDPNRARIADLAARFDAEELQLNYQIAIHARQDLPHAPDAYAGFTMSLLRMAAFRPGGEGETRSSGGAAQGSTGAPKGPARRAAADAANGPAGPAAAEAANGPAGPGAANGPARRAADANGPARRAAAESARAPAHGATDKPVALGNWAELVKSLELGGIARQLAQQSALAGYADGVVELRIAPGFRDLAQKPYQEKLRAALEQHLGQPVRLKIQVGNTGGESAQERAVESISRDEFVRGLMEQFDATIVDSSIKPTR
jgi:DNA polymerase-3 subunit gamma/tau